jgi:signal transduction histidine kinase
MTLNLNGQPTVLVVDDEPDILTAIADLLEEEFRLLATTDPEEALGLLSREEVAVILSDQRMPRMSGDQFLGRARQICPASRILLTGYSDPHTLIRAVNQGQIHAYVNKPWDPLELRLLVQRAAQQYQMHQQIEQSEARLRSLLEHLPEGVCLVEGERLVLANPVGREYLQALGATGAQVERLGGRPLPEFLVPRADGLAHEVEVASPPRRVFAVALSPLPGAEQALVLRELTREREVLARVQQQQRLAAVGQLAAGIAHDFNNLLTVITGFSQTLERRAELSAEAREGLNTISRYGDRAAQMIRQILDFSRSRPVEQAPMELGAFVKEAMKTLGQVLPEHLRVGVEISGSYPVRASVSQLQQVLTNLVVNARDAMPQGGELKVGLSSLQVGAEPPLPGMAPGEWVVWTVSDSGMGIPPEVLGRIYEPFFTTKGEQGGTGLGLAQVYGIVKQHQGYIDVKSQAGEGTTFAVYLPRLAGEEQAGREGVAQGLPGQGQTLLVVEDQAAVLNVVQLLLEGLGYRVLVAANGRQALAVYQQQREQIALVLTDWMMPQMDGGELIAALRQVDPQVRVVVMSGYAQKKEEQMAQLKTAGWLDKPVKVDQLTQVLHQALG